VEDGGASGLNSAEAAAPFATFVQQLPLDLVGAVTTVSLSAAVPGVDVTMKKVLLTVPRMWLHQQFAEELAIVCSEHSASALLDSGDDVQQAMARGSRRSEKKQRQKLRRRQEAQEAARRREVEQELADREQERLHRRREAHTVVEGLLQELVQSVVEGCGSQDSGPRDDGATLMDQAASSEGQPREVAVQVGDLAAVMASRLEQPPAMVHTDFGGILADGATVPVGMIAAGGGGVIATGPAAMLSTGPGSMLDDWDGHISEVSSIGVATTSRSESISDSFGRQYLSHMALAERRRLDAEWLRSRRRPRHPMRRWHDDSRLEFLLRNRDRWATELEWDRMSQGSVPASLDEGALYPVGLESRFAYLFDSPPRSHVTTALGSQAAAEDDAERLHAPWDDVEEWQSLTQALEKVADEREMWKAKAQELEGLLVSGPTHNGNGSACSSNELDLGTRPTLNRQSSVSSSEKEKVVTTAAASSPMGASPLGGATPTSSGIGSAGEVPVVGGNGAIDVVPSARRRRRISSGDASDISVKSPTEHAWRYLVLLALARRQIDLQRQALDRGRHADDGLRTPPPRDCEGDEAGGVPRRLNEEQNVVSRSVSTPGLWLRPAVPPGESSAADVAGLTSTDCGPQGPKGVASVMRLETSRSPSPPSGGEVSSSPPARGPEARKRALHVTFDARYKRSSMVDAETQTAPAITLSRMYGGMVPRYIQRELARLRQENQILRYRIASLAMSQPIGRPRPVRHQATQTAPALTFSTARQQGSGVPTIPVSSMPRLPSGRDLAGLRQVDQKLDAFQPVFDPCRLPSDCVRRVLDASILAFVHAVEQQTQRQDAYRLLVQRLCKRAAQVLWPRSSVELYGSFASGLALPSSGLDLVIYPHRNELRRRTSSDGPGCEQRLLSPIDEDMQDELRPCMPLDAVSPGHPSSVPSTSSGWQQQLSGRLAQEKWVLSDSIRITAHAAIPVLSLIATPEEATATEAPSCSPPATPGAEPEDTASCPIRVDISLEDPNHRGLRSKAMISWLLAAYPHARAVTLVLKQWLIERTYGMSHTGGLCSYGVLLMVVGFLQQHPASSPAEALVGFLDFYGRWFNPREYGVSVARGALLHRKGPTCWPPPQAEYSEQGFCPSAQEEFASLPRKLSITGEEAHRFDPLWIEDPLNPTNNVGRNCFRIRQIQRSLARAAEALTASDAGWQLRTILRVDGQAHRQDGERDIGGSHVDAAPWRESVTAKHALHEDLFQSMATHEPNLMLPLPVHAQIARSHLPQQWDSAVRYTARPFSAGHAGSGYGGGSSSSAHLRGRT